MSVCMNAFFSTLKSQGECLCWGLLYPDSDVGTAHSYDQCRVVEKCFFRSVGHNSYTLSCFQSSGVAQEAKSLYKGRGNDATSISEPSSEDIVLHQQGSRALGRG